MSGRGAPLVKAKNEFNEEKEVSLKLQGVEVEADIAYELQLSMQKTSWHSCQLCHKAP